MAQALADNMASAIERVAHQYYRLVLVVAPVDARTTTALQAIAAQHNLHHINLNLALSQRLLEIPERRRPLEAVDILEGIISKSGSGSVLLANTELLFDTSLKLNPLSCLQQFARHRTIVASWNGRLEGGALLYATVDHPEYRRYPITDLTLVTLDT